MIKEKNISLNLDGKSNKRMLLFIGSHLRSYMILDPQGELSLEIDVSRKYANTGRLLRRLGCRIDVACAMENMKDMKKTYDNSSI